MSKKVIIPLKMVVFQVQLGQRVTVERYMECTLVCILMGKGTEGYFSFSLWVEPALPMVITLWVLEVSTCLIQLISARQLEGQEDVCNSLMRRDHLITTLDLDRFLLSIVKNT